jgi:HEPN domain-containing protein
MNAIEEALRLLNRANADLTALRNMGDVGIFDEGIFGFHAQQAVEKALKAWLAAKDQTYPLRHDLGELFDALARVGEEAREFQALSRLTPYAVQFRYDEISIDDERLDRPKTVGEVGALVEWVENRVDSLAHADPSNQHDS